MEILIDIGFDEVEESCEVGITDAFGLLFGVLCNLV